ncbi:cupin domain-containing protein [Amycolatopsis sp. RM579]|uniref:Cupin domain-containing protein n=2 Tax=Amycolatopsis pithecellobii TaxID=664692 RepID=A0A6N7YZA2_9PSEU|nr:cupin domain-containing protein [Amycolatopsis pithecellobii]
MALSVFAVAAAAVLVSGRRRAWPVSAVSAHLPLALFAGPAFVLPVALAAGFAVRPAFALERWATYSFAELAAERDRSRQRYLEFLRRHALSAGIYVLAAGTDDPQQPHREDELYFVIEGRARFGANGESRHVGPGCLIYVPAGLPHRFTDIEADLSVLVVFAPAETSL